MRVSIVTTLYRSSRTLEDFYRRAVAAVRTLTTDYELVFVNDGSPDDSLNIALRLFEEDERVVVVDLSRNFGHHQAIMTGLARARGDVIFLIDSDLEEDPAWLTSFVDTMQRTDADVVYGVQDARKGGAFERFTGWLFYRTANLLLEHPIPHNVLTVRLMSRRYVRSLVRHRERVFAIAGLWSNIGFKQVPVPVRKEHRRYSTYGIPTRIAALVRALTAFSATPLVFIFYLGVALLITSLSVAAYLTVAQLVFDAYLDGWVSVFVSVWFFGGLIIFCIGVVGIYLAQVLTEVKRRPLTIVRRLYRHEQRHVRS